MRSLSISLNENNVILNSTNLRNITNVTELLIYIRHHRRALARYLIFDYTCVIYFLLYLLI